jgi:predicted small secreted protein
MALKGETRQSLNSIQKSYMKTLKQLILSLCLLVSVGAFVTGCRTAHGFGEDMEHAGQSIQDNTDQR